jgi:hypothetical protein
VDFEEPVHPSSSGRGGFHFVARAYGVSLQIFVEKPRQLRRGGVVGGFVGPTFARAQDFCRLAGHLGNDFKPEHRIAFDLRFCEGPAVDGVNNRAGVLEADALAGTVAAAAPPVFTSQTRALCLRIFSASSSAYLLGCQTRNGPPKQGEKVA